jgi:RimJ/RimL family protein N-acetyltransferase
MSETIRLRAARADDEERLRVWRNDPVAKAASFASHTIQPSEHHRWFVTKLGDSNCVLLIVEVNGEPVGQIRLDRVDSEVAVVSIGLAPRARGRGVGRAALRLAAAVAADRLAVLAIEAHVKPENTASLSAFKAAGFEQVRSDADSVVLRCSLPGTAP